MKKILFAVVAILMAVSLFTAVAEAQTYVGRKVFSIGGEFIEYIPFSFTVPSGNCGNVRTFEYVQSYSYPPAPAYWTEVFPGEVIPGYSTGIFHFIVDATLCDPEFVLEGPVFDGDVYGKWFGMEQEPEDLGVLVKGVGTAKNFFNLSTDDLRFSYEIIFPSYGRKYSLLELVKYASNGNSGVQPSGSDLVGAIISDRRGFLLQKIFYPRNLKRSVRTLWNSSKNIIINDDMLVVLIYKENY